MRIQDRSSSGSRGGVRVTPEGLEAHLAISAAMVADPAVFGHRSKVASAVEQPWHAVWIG